MQTFESHCVRQNFVFFGDDEDIVLAGRDGSVRRLSLETSAALTHEGHSNRVNSVLFVSGSAKVASVSYDNTLRFWSADTGQARLIAFDCIRLDCRSDSAIASY